MKSSNIEKQLITNNNKMIEFMAQIRDAMNSINETNVLHIKSIDSNTNTILEMVKANSSLIGFIRWIVVALVIAIIVLAGAEKALKFITT